MSKTASFTVQPACTETMPLAWATLTITGDSPSLLVIFRTTCSRLVEGTRILAWLKGREAGVSGNESTLRVRRDIKERRRWDRVSPDSYRRSVNGRQLEAHCGCGVAWFVFAFEDPEDLEIECLACGETVVDVRDLGEHHSAGSDVEP